MNATFRSVGYDPILRAFSGSLTDNGMLEIRITVVNSELVMADKGKGYQLLQALVADELHASRKLCKTFIDRY